MLSLFGSTVFFALLFGMLWRTAVRWRYLATTYAGASNRPVDSRGLQTAVLLGLGGFNSLKGILKIGVHETGVSLRIVPPFSLFHAPLFIPYADIQGWTTTWYLNAPSTELAFRRAPEVKMVMPQEQAEWIAKHAGQKFDLRDEPPPEGKAGRGWHAFAVVHMVLSLAMLAVVLFVLISQWLAS